MVYIMLGHGFEEIEAVTPCDLLRRAGVPVTLVGIGGQEIEGSHGMVLRADVTLDALVPEDMEMVFLPGGRVGVESILAAPKALDVVKTAWESGKFVAAICAAPTILAGLGITAGKNATCYPDSCWTDKMQGAALSADAAAVRDGCLITGTSAGCAVPFGLALVAALRGQDAADRVAKGIVIR